MSLHGLNIELDQIKAKLDVALNKAAEKWGKVLNLSNIRTERHDSYIGIHIEFKFFVDGLPPMQTYCCSFNNGKTVFYNDTILVDINNELNFGYTRYAEQLIFNAWFSNCRTPEEFIHNATLYAAVVNKTSIKLKA